MEKHPLRAWRHKNNVLLHDMALSSGISIASISRVERWKQPPTHRMIAAIMRATDGMVRPEDFFGDIK